MAHRPSNQLQELYNEFQHERVYGSLKRSNDYGSRTEFNVSLKRDPMMFEENSSVHINIPVSEHRCESAASIDSPNINSNELSMSNNNGNFYCSPFTKC